MPDKPTLALVPTHGELDELIRAIELQGHLVEAIADPRVRSYRVPNLALTVALGGHGKVQFAVHTQYFLGRHVWGLVACAGAAGALVDDVASGDVIVATETVEHDIRKCGRPFMPRFVGDESTLVRCRTRVRATGSFRVHFGAIASGDEDVVSAMRREECQRATGALAVAWEGAGGARACAFSGIPFVEMRGITDNADPFGSRDFRVNLRTAMGNLSTVLGAVIGEAV